MSDLATQIGVKSACEVLKVPRSRVYRQQQAKVEPSPRPTPAHALSSDERAQVRATLNSERFMDQAAQIEGAYPLHILGLKTSYGPDYPTTSKPVVWAQRLLQTNGSYPWGEFFWLSISYQQALNQHHSPR